MEITSIIEKNLGNIISFIFACGFFYAQIQGVNKSIARLESKQDETNNMKIRVAVLETEKEIQRKRIDDLEKILHNRSGKDA